MSTFTIQLSEHAIQRFRQRVRPAIGVAEAEGELARLALFGDLVPEAPAWHAVATADTAPWYLVIADCVLPLRPHWREAEVLVATTCLARGDVSEATRFRRQARRRAAEADHPGGGLTMQVLELLAEATTAP